MKNKNNIIFKGVVFITVFITLVFGIIVFSNIPNEDEKFDYIVGYNDITTLCDYCALHSCGYICENCDINLPKCMEGVYITETEDRRNLK